MTTQAKTEPARSNGRASHRGSGALVIARAATDQARGVVLRVGDSLPPLATASQRFLSTSMGAIERASDERISAGTTLSLGLAIGLLISGAPRLLVAMALAPVAAMGLALLDRRSLRVTRVAAPTAAA
jgi:hypothetical protein